MNIKELINELSKYDQDMEVFTTNWQCEYGEWEPPEEVVEVFITEDNQLIIR